MAEEMKRGGGIITEEDLKRYRPIVREPVQGTYRGHTVISMPPPSSGGTVLIEMLNMVEPADSWRVVTILLRTFICLPRS